MDDEDEDGGLRTDLEGVVLCELNPSIDKFVDCRSKRRAVVAHHRVVSEVIVPQVVRDDHHDVWLWCSRGEDDSRNERRQ